MHDDAQSLPLGPQPFPFQLGSNRLCFLVSSFGVLVPMLPLPVTRVPQIDIVCSWLFTLVGARDGCFYGLTLMQPARPPTSQCQRQR